MWGWPLLLGISKSARFVERIRDGAWTEHLLRFDRVTVSDVAQRGRTLGLYGDAPPRGTRWALAPWAGFRAI